MVRVFIKKWLATHAELSICIALLQFIYLPVTAED